MDNYSSPEDPFEGQAEQASVKMQRPRSVTLLVLGVLIITVVNLTRLILSIKYWDFLASWPGVYPLYMLLTGLIWTLAGLPLLLGLWRAKNWAPRLMEAVALTYALYYWLDQVFLVDHPVSGAEGAWRALLPVNWQFAVGMTVFTLMYIAWTLSRTKVKAYFGITESNSDRSKTDSDDNG